MTTPYSSVAHLPVADWNAVMTDYQYVLPGDDAEDGPRVGIWHVDAANDVEAEQRVLRFIETHYEDDLRGAVAVSQGDNDIPARYVVHINFPTPRD